MPPPKSVVLPLVVDLPRDFPVLDVCRVVLPLVVGQGAGGTSYSVPIQTLLFFTALSFLPAVLLLMTGFTRIVIVLSLLRQAIGTQAAPPNQVVVGLSLFLTFFVMSPTIDKVYADAYQPYAENKIAFARQFYNDSVLGYNNRIQSFPANALAGMFNFTPREYFEGDPGEQGPVTVSF